MQRSVRALSDIVELYTVQEEGAEDMGAPRKNRAERLDKIIQFIWDYQDRHAGLSPTLEVIGRHVGISAQAIGYYITILVDEGRLDRITVRPFRGRIIESNKQNQKAIDRFKRLREKMDEHHAEERDRIREEQERLARADQREKDRTAALALVETKPEVESIPSSFNVSERPAIARNWERQMHPETMTTMERYDQAQADLKSVNKEIRMMMPRLLKVADERDLVLELVNRGYRVDKVR
jgi:hypothetical protein